MIYHVGRVLDQQFGYEPVMVRVEDESPERSTFNYPKLYESIELGDLAGAVERDDIFLPLASAADFGFGLALPCRKLLYVQGVNTYRVLDGFMDGYVSVSEFVQKTIRSVYGIDSPVIHPFIEFERLPEQLAWKDRNRTNVILFAKSPPPVDALIVEFLKRLSVRHPGIKAHFRVVERGLRHAELMALLASTRYVVGLSPVEGFGLVPLEAMASGCAVVAFHGGGSLAYMTDKNSRNVGYPHMDALVDQFAQVFLDDSLAESLAARGRSDAQGFTKSRFEAQWLQYLRWFKA